ncbi:MULTISPECIES: hypothetical protein [Morganellaceae]|uniref:Uncharacterized protein n=3 Tax=Morganellaceae TaxID=1903414 RepID=A0A1B8HMU1_9GAMM|nr:MULTISPECIES: hypothetical protein [Morganellaceae]OBU10541.1 hypothetical protein AYY17_15465 [Morganella psychrotolerans]QCJ72195.1 hypothetical protein C9446_20550 [Providencia heimbachae]UNH29073.1 hypothetical protein MNY64_16115 [Moellerella wisconsensis]UNH32656.1 hypothetical protein MNY72_16665 [Moellerella wisconsensis]UNH40612.1 hypothetical protein MNY70_17395 [Moellerella wisconsensis]
MAHIQFNNAQEQALFDALLASALNGVSTSIWDQNRPNAPRQEDVANVAFALAADAFELRRKYCKVTGE